MKRTWILLLISTLPMVAQAKDEALFMMDEREVWDVRLEMIRRERKEIFGIYYLWDGNRVGAAGLAEYLDAAKRGVKVRLIIDGLSAIQNRSLPKGLKKILEPIAPSSSIRLETMKALELSGVEIRIFNPLRLDDWKSLVPPRVLTRTHEKFTFFSEQNAILLGDRNWQAYNFRLKKSAPGESYRSVEVLLKGDSASGVRSYIDQLWDDPRLTRRPDYSNLRQEHVNSELEYLRRIKLKSTEHGVRNPTRVEDIFARLQGVEGAQFIHDQPSAKLEARGVDHALAKWINEAKESITFVSPYILLTPRYRKMIREAQSRGVKIRILTASPLTTDAPLASAAFEIQSRELVKEGVEIFHHQGPDFLHAKMILVDGRRAGILTHNFDFVSEYLNYESGLLLDDVGFTNTVSTFIDQMIRDESSVRIGTRIKPSLYCLGLLSKFVAENPPLRKISYD